jgi:signal peptidase II
MTRPGSATSGLLLAALVLALDQATKVLIHQVVMVPPRIIEVTGFLNLVLVWNPGISFGLLGEGSAVQVWLLSAFGTIVAGGLIAWLIVGVPGRLASAAVGLVAGGALGNVIDRLRFGAVMDFVDVHAYGWHWPAFNVADAGITFGVIGLLLDSLLRERAARRT